MLTFSVSVSQGPMRFYTYGYSISYSTTYADYLYRRLDQDFPSAGDYTHACGSVCDLESRCQFSVHAYHERRCYFGDLSMNPEDAVAIPTPEEERRIHSMSGKTREKGVTALQAVKSRLHLQFLSRFGISFRAIIVPRRRKKVWDSI